MIEVLDIDGYPRMVNPQYVVEVVPVYGKLHKAAIKLHNGEWIRAQTDYDVVLRRLASDRHALREFDPAELRERCVQAFLHAPAPVDADAMSDSRRVYAEAKVDAVLAEVVRALEAERG